MNTTTKTRRLNLADAVEDLAPTPPKCFLNHLAWREYLKSAATSQSHKGEPKVIKIVGGQPAFDFGFPFCADCTQVKSVEMMAQGRCDPDFLKNLDKQK